MKHKRIVWILTAALVISMFCLTGCGSKSSDTAETKTEEETKAKEEEKKTEEAPAAEAETEAEQPAQTEPEPEPEAKTMYTTYDLAFRAEAKKDSEKLGAVPVNTEVKVLDTSKDYYKIEYKGKQGYVLGEYLTEDKKVAEQAAKDAAAQAAQQQKNTGGNGGGGGGKKNKECLTGGVLN